MQTRNTMYVIRIDMHKVDMEKEEQYTYFIPTYDYRVIRDKLEKLIHEAIESLTDSFHGSDEIHESGSTEINKQEINDIMDSILKPTSEVDLDPEPEPQPQKKGRTRK